MRDDERKLARLDVAFFEHATAGLAHYADGVSKDLAPVHANDVRTNREIFHGRRPWTRTRADGEQVAARPIGAEDVAEDADIGHITLGDDGGTCSVPEEHTSCAILPVRDAREFFRGDNECVLVLSRAQHVAGDLQ